MSTLTHSTKLVVTSCWCGIALAIPESLERMARKDHKQEVFCPLGHSFVEGCAAPLKTRPAPLNVEPAPPEVR